MEDLLELASTLVYSKTGSALNYAQRIVLRESLQDAKKTYDRIAVEKGYSPSYLKNGVAPRLWNLLSEVVGEKVSKINCRFLLEQKLRAGLNSQVLDPVSIYASVLAERPGGQVPLASPFYIARSPVESLCYTEILKPRALLRLKAPRRVGKTSLMVRLLDFAEKQGCQVVQLSLNQADSRTFSSTETFLRWLCVNASRQLGLTSQLDQYWDEDMGALVNCTLYFQEGILTPIQEPVILALDEVSQLFQYPSLARDVMALLRSWYEETRDIPVWQRLRLLLVNSTDVYIPLDINRSPFNVGLALEIPNFTMEEVKELTQRHQLGLSSESLIRLYQFSGGFPYLVRLALYQSVVQEIDLDQLLHYETIAPKIFREHLQEQTYKLQQHPQLFEVYRHVVMAQAPIFVEPSLGFKLQSLGLTRLVGDRLLVSCQLYRCYFQGLYQRQNRAE